jgi:hypothetical protein
MQAVSYVGPARALAASVIAMGLIAMLLRAAGIDLPLPAIPSIHSEEQPWVISATPRKPVTAPADRTDPLERAVRATDGTRTQAPKPAKPTKPKGHPTSPNAGAPALAPSPLPPAHVPAVKVPPVPTPPVAGPVTVPELPPITVGGITVPPLLG